MPAVAPEVARALVRAELPDVVDAALDDAGVDAVVAQVRRTGAGPTARLTGEDLLGALGVFLLVSLATLPVVLPFVFIQEVGPALRVSNGIALAMLFIAGRSFGKASGLPPRRVGFVIMVLGLVLVGITMALGG
jgi:VIT1/CCC1 family predicted Fe2+/Mn2+ transporter